MKKFCCVFLIVSSSILFSFGQISESNKRNAMTAYNSAVDEIVSGNFQEAFALLNYSIELNSSEIQPKLTLAKVKIELDLTDEALKDISSLLAGYPQNGEAQFFMAYLTFDGRADSSVLEGFNRAISLGYEESQAYYYRGLSHFLLGNNQAAVSDFSAAIEKDRYSSLAWHDRGTARKALGDFQGALNDYRMATENNLGFSVAFNNMGSMKIILGDYQGAIQDYTVAINIDSTFHVAYNNRGAANFYLGNFKEALNDFEKSVFYQEEYIPALINKASTLAKGSDYDEALLIFNGVLELTDQNGIAFLNRGLVKEIMGDVVGACEDWQKALELGASQAELYVKECN